MCMINDDIKRLDHMTRLEEVEIEMVVVAAATLTPETPAPRVIILEIASFTVVGRTVRDSKKRALRPCLESRL